MEILSTLKKKPTQGDPFEMPMYALTTMPLFRKLTTSMKQTLYVDDAAVTGKIAYLHVWWNEITRLGPSY